MSFHSADHLSAERFRYSVVLQQQSQTEYSVAAPVALPLVPLNCAIITVLAVDEAANCVRVCMCIGVR